jgi:DNA-binding transcriptional ArsR family regulator
MALQSAKVNDVFRALADPTRRAILERLARGTAGASALAKPFDMALPSFTQHLDILEQSGLVRSMKLGRIRMYKLAPQSLKVAEAWLSRQRRTWDCRFDQLDKHLLEMKEKAP